MLCILTPEMGDYGGAVPVIPHFRRSGKRFGPKNKPSPFISNYYFINNYIYFFIAFKNTCYILKIYGNTNFYSRKIIWQQQQL
jgi:hypothetical protein